MWQREDGHWGPFPSLFIYVRRVLERMYVNEISNISSAILGLKVDQQHYERACSASRPPAPLVGFVSFYFVLCKVTCFLDCTTKYKPHTTSRNRLASLSTRRSNRTYETANILHSHHNPNNPRTGTRAEDLNLRHRAQAQASLRVRSPFVLGARHVATSRTGP